MHMLGEPRTMQDDPRYDDVVDEVESFLGRARRGGGGRRGARGAHLRSTPASASARRSRTTSRCCAPCRACARLGPLLLGVSRKRFLGALTGREVAADRVAASVAATLYCYRGGATCCACTTSRDGRCARGRARAGG